MTKRILSSRSGEVAEAAPLFNDRLGKLLEDPIHVGALAGPHALQEADVAAVTGDEEGQVGILLHSLHWNRFRGDKPVKLCVPPNGISKKPINEPESPPWEGEKTSSAAFRHNIGTCTDLSLWTGLASW